MIPAAPGWEACFEHKTEGGNETMPVLAWDDDGNAMVPVAITGRLVSVHHRFDNWSFTGLLRRLSDDRTEIPPDDFH